MQYLHHLFQETFIGQSIRSVFLFVFCITLIFVPVAPVLILIPSEEKWAEGIRLGFEIQKAEAAFGNGYNYRRSITINESQVTGPSNFTNFPVLISFADSTFRTTGNGGNVTDAQGDDIIFTSDADGSVPLDYERERYNATTGEITAWVEVPTLNAGTNTVIYMFYGNSSVSASQENITGTWDANYKGVWHLHETSGSHLDSTSNNNDSTGVTVTTQGSTFAKFSGADTFDGVDDVVTLTENGTLDITNTGTIEAWVKTTSTSSKPTNVSTWTTRTAPAGVSADEYSQLDSVIVGERVYYANVNCADASDTFKTASSTASLNSFTTWAAGTSPTGACAIGEGSSVAIDSDGVFLWYAVLNNDGTTGTFSYATSTLAGTFSGWKNPANPTGIQGDESSSIDIVITGNRAYFYVLMQAGTAEDDMVAAINLDGSGWSGWIDPNNTPPAGTASEGCGAGIDTEGNRLYVGGMCGATTDYGRINMPLDLLSTTAFTTGDNVPTSAGSTDHAFNDVTAVGGHLYHAAASFSGATEAYMIASSTLDGANATLSTWVNIQNGGVPNGTAATNSFDAAVETDGKSLFYSAFLHNGTTPVWYTASSTLQAHPAVSKLNAYEIIQVGDGYVFDWVGKPQNFGMTTGPDVFEHVAVAHDGTKINYYKNGALMASTTVSTDFESNNNTLLLGKGFRSDGTGIFFPGVIDEIRVSNTARSADWILTQYNNQNATSTFYTLGSEETPSNPPTVTTNFANPGATTAMFHGTKTGGEDATQHGFAWGTASNLSGGDTATTTLGALTTNSSFTSRVSGLSEGATYYFRAYAQGATGWGYGIIRSFIAGSATPARTMRLFEGYRLKIFSGRITVF